MWWTDGRGKGVDGAGEAAEVLDGPVEPGPVAHAPPVAHDDHEGLHGLPRQLPRQAFKGHCQAQLMVCHHIGAYGC